MKKLILTICLAVTAVLALHAETFSGNIVVNLNGVTYDSEATVTVEQGDNGLYNFTLQVPVFGTMNMYDVHAATASNIAVFSAERDVVTSQGTMRTILFVRTIDGMMAANVAIPARNTTMWFNTVGDHFQLPNSDFEAWNSNYQDEPNRWHGFMSAFGNSFLVSTSQSLVKLNKSEDTHAGSNGSYSVVMTSGSTFGIVANGTMTNGQLKAASMSASSPDNHAEMDKNKGTDDFYMPLYAKPDKFNVWLKFTTADNNNMANVSVKTFDGTYYQEPVDKTYTNLSGSIVGGAIPAGDWTFYSFPFDYDSYATNNAATEAIFVTFSTNGTPGGGNSGDALYVDDMELVYLGNMTDLRYQGTTIDGWDPAMTVYNMEMTGEPNLADFTADIEGASAVLTKSMEQNADGSYRIAISVVSADLQNAACYIINVTQPSKRGDLNGDGRVNIADVTALINYVLSRNPNGINVQNADIDENGIINIADVTFLINLVLSGNV